MKNESNKQLTARIFCTNDEEYRINDYLKHYIDDRGYLTVWRLPKDESEPCEFMVFNHQQWKCLLCTNSNEHDN